MITNISIKRIIPQILFQKLTSHDTSFANLEDDQLIERVYNWGIDRVNYYYTTGSKLGSIQMCIQMKAHNLVQNDNPKPCEMLQVLIDAFEIYKKLL
jgi:hypothetical protein